MKRLAGMVVALGGLSWPAYAQGPVVYYESEQMVYGSCRPVLGIWNTTKDTLDYVQIDVAYQLRDGRTVNAEQKSRYEYGVADPIAPTTMHSLSIHHDESTPLGTACNDIVAGTITHFICRTTANQPCAGMPGLRVGARLAMPKRP